MQESQSSTEPWTTSPRSCQVFANHAVRPLPRTAPTADLARSRRPYSGDQACWRSVCVVDVPRQTLPPRLKAEQVRV